MARTGRDDLNDWSDDISFFPLRDRRLTDVVGDPTLRKFGFSREEIRRIQAYYRSLAREPSDVELAGLAQSWSEHCSYKSSRPYLRTGFRDLRGRPRVLGTGDAGVLEFEDGFAYAIRIESHNHPSAVEPYGGAATGIGGILRDVLAVGAKPIALTDPLFFGPLLTPPGSLPAGVHPPNYLLNGVVAGIRDYGNRVGVPTVSGGIYFDPAYAVNPLVNVGCLGFLPRQRLIPNRARAAGDQLVLVGGLTGRDGIGGVAFASHELTERSTEESRGAVQLGDPILKEPLIRACVECFDRGLIHGLKDLGGGGLATGAGELAFGGGFGLRVDLDRVPLREPRLKPWEIWISESQERMILSVRSEAVGDLMAVFERHDVPAHVIGEIIPGKIEKIDYRGRAVARSDLRFRVNPPPMQRKTRRPRPARRGSPNVAESDIPQLFEEMVLAPDNVSRESVIRVYDHEVQGHTTLKSLQGQVDTPSHGDAAVLKPRADSWRGIAVTVATQPWACREDPRNGAIWVTEEAARNLYAVGARPDAFTNCLNFGNPEDPKVLGAFAEVVRGLASGARALGFAVPSGNVSFYNGGLGQAIPPTPVLMATGILDDVRRGITSDFKTPGNPIFLIGTSRSELGGSLWARRRNLAGLAIPPTDPRTVRLLGERLLRLGRTGILRAVHDVSDGGLAATLAEMAFGGSLGFTVDLAKIGVSAVGTALVTEGMSRWVAEVDPAHLDRFTRVFRNLTVAHLGIVSERSGRILWNGLELAQIDLESLREKWRRGLGGLQLGS
jgi:phosphoribosylformylglycinamidine synthase